MRLQRYPDGANAWCLFIWGRHPKWSLTWTHSVTLTRHRPESGQRRWGLYRILGNAIARYGVTAFGISLQLTTQKPLRREAAE